MQDKILHQEVHVAKLDIEKDHEHMENVACLAENAPAREKDHKQSSCDLVKGKGLRVAFDYVIVAEFVMILL